jgi:phosphoserine phosphatase
LDNEEASGSIPLSSTNLSLAFAGDLRRGERLPQTNFQRPFAGAAEVPLCVDLDGTLVKSDTLVDSLLVLLRSRPALLVKLPGRLLRGKAAFKAFVSASISLDVAHLPYNRALLHFLQEERARGREIYLATGADLSVARRVAAHLGVFTDVLGSDGATNLTGARKLDSLRARLGTGGFGYIGNSRADLPLLAAAAEPMVANPSLGLRLGLRLRGIHPMQEFEDRAHPLKSLLKAARLHQWTKNLLIFVPLLLSHAIGIHLSYASGIHLSHDRGNHRLCRYHGSPIWENPAIRRADATIDR